MRADGKMRLTLAIALLIAVCGLSVFSGGSGAETSAAEAAFRATDTAAAGAIESGPGEYAEDGETGVDVDPVGDGCVQRIGAHGV